MAEEIGRLFGLLVEVGRYTSDDMWMVVGAAGDHPFQVGTRWPFDGPSVMALVHDRAASARIDSYDELKGEIARVARDAGFRSAIGAPIVVRGRTWGAIIAVSTAAEPIPDSARGALAGVHGACRNRRLEHAGAGRPRTRAQPAGLATPRRSSPREPR